VLRERIIHFMIQNLTPTKLLLVADQRRVGAESGPVRRYRIARLRRGAVPTPGVALSPRKST
jgi:hypothetical protein